MLGRSKKPSKNNPSVASSPVGDKQLNSIVHGTSIEGTITAGSDIRIDGKLKGVLNCQGKLVIGSTGEVEGEVTCQDAMIEGKFTGKLVVREMLTIRDSAVVNGDISTDKLVVQSGAVFNVQCAMGGQLIKGFEKGNGRSKGNEKDALKLG